jgi:cyclophilin family peptidyl-prolyl cis-trans isomerase
VVASEDSDMLRDTISELFSSDPRWSYRGEARIDPPNALKKCRFEIELFSKEVPKASKNFYELCKGGVEKKGQKTLGYKDTSFHRFVKGFCLQGGDVNGKGGDSIYKDGFFKDEKAGLKMLHDRIGIVSYANSGPNTNRSQFFFTLSEGQSPHPCDGKHVVVGKVVNPDAIEFLQIINETVNARDDETPDQDIFIQDCGCLD